MKKTILRSLSFALILTMLLGMAPFACADSVPADVEELMEMFDDRVSAPKENSLLSETETMVVQSKHGKSIYVLAKAGGGKKLFTADEGAEVTVYARQSGYSLGIVKGTAVGGWMNSQYLVEPGAYTAPSSGKAPSNGKADKLIAKGLSYELGDGEKQDYVKAEECYKKAIELGSTEAMARLAMLYYKNDAGDSRRTPYEGELDSPLGTEDHAEQVLELLENAAGKNDAYAMYLLAYLFYEGEAYMESYKNLGVSKDKAVAIEYYLKASGKGSVEATRRLNEIYYDALSKDGDDPEASEWIQGRIKKNDPYAMWLYAGLLEEQGNSDEADRLYSQAEKTALDQKDPLTLYLIALKLYDDGEDKTKATKMFENAAKAGGAGYITELIWSEYEEDLYELACKTVIKYGNADDLLSAARRMHEDLGYIDNSDSYAIQCALLSAEKGSLGGLLELCCQIQDCGFSDPADCPKGVPERAFKVVLEAAKKDIFPWMCDCSRAIVWMYENGFGCKINEKEARKWYDHLVSLGLEEEMDWED